MTQGLSFKIQKLKPMLKKQGPRVNHNRRNQNSRTKSQSQPKEPKLKDQELWANLTMIETQESRTKIQIKKTMEPRLQDQEVWAKIRNQDSRDQGSRSKTTNQGSKTKNNESKTKDPRNQGSKT